MKRCEGVPEPVGGDATAFAKGVLHGGSKDTAAEVVRVDETAISAREDECFAVDSARFLREKR